MIRSRGWTTMGSCVVFVAIIAFVESNNEYVNSCVKLFTPECAHSKCMLRPFDILEEDEVSHVKVEKYMQAADKVFPGNSMLQSVRKRCLNGKFDTLWPEEGCQARKYQACIYFSMLVDSLGEWKDSDYCKKMAATSKQCKAVLDKTG